MKDLMSMIAGLTLLLVLLLMIHDVNAKDMDETQLIMERFNRVQILYDQGLEQYDMGNKFQGCNLLREATRESHHVGDGGQTERQVRPIYEKLCSSSKQ